MTATTPPNVAAKAAEPVQLSLHELTLIGLFSGPSGRAALLRGAGGQIARVSPGDEAFGLQVAAMDDRVVHLTDKAGRVTTLSLPQG
jgi:hypothetical protein